MTVATSEDEQHPSTLAPTFGAGGLAHLRAGRYRPGAWVSLLSDSWAQSRATATRHPTLTRSWRRLALTIAGTSALAASVPIVRRSGTRHAAIAAIWLAGGNSAHMTDLYVHLGLHRDTDGSHYPVLGAPMTLTAMRGWTATWLISQIAARRLVPLPALVVALATIIITDITDGPLARAQDRSSPLGAYLDGEADLFAWGALTVAQARRGQLPNWFAVAVTFRWLMPTIVGLIRSFATTTPVAPRRSLVGIAAGSAHVALAATALLAEVRADSPDAPRWSRVCHILTVLTSVGFIAATTSHLWRLRRH